MQFIKVNMNTKQAKVTLKLKSLQLIKKKHEKTENCHLGYV